MPWAASEAPAPGPAAIGQCLALAGLPSDLAPAVEVPDGPCRAPIPLGPEPAVRGRSGAYHLAWRDGAVHLTVSAPVDGGAPVRRDDVAGVLEEVPGVVIDEEALAGARPS